MLLEKNIPFALAHSLAVRPKRLESVMLTSAPFSKSNFAIWSRPKEQILY